MNENWYSQQRLCINTGFQIEAEVNWKIALNYHISWQWTPDLNILELSQSLKTENGVSPRRRYMHYDGIWLSTEVKSQEAQFLLSDILHSG